MDDRNLLLFLEAHTNYKIREFGEYALMDAYMLNEGLLAGFIERKTRNVPIGKYDTAIIDYAKYEAMVQLEKTTQLDCWLAYGWSCGTVGVVKPTSCPIQVKKATPSEGSVSLNAGLEREVAHIEIRRFDILGTVA